MGVKVDPIQENKQPRKKPEANKGKESVGKFLPNVTLNASEELPSKGISYPPNAVISYKPYTFGEVKTISQSKLDTKGVFDTILSGVEVDFPVEDLTLADVLYIGLLRKISTMGTSKLDVRYNCKKCGKQNQMTVENSMIEFDDVDLDLKEDELPIELILDDSEGEEEVFEFMPLTLGNYYKLIEEGEEQNEVAMLAMQCRNKDFDYALERFFNAGPEDGRDLQKVDRILYHGVKPIEDKCSQELTDEKNNKAPCDYLNEVELEGGRAIVLPFRGRKGSDRSRVRIRKKGNS